MSDDEDIFNAPVAEETVPAEDELGGEDPFDAPVDDADADAGAAADADDDGFGFGDTAATGADDDADDAEDDLFNAEPVGGGDDAADAFGAAADEPAPAAAAEPQESAQLVFARKFRAIVQERDSEEQAKRQERVERADGELDQWRSMRSEHREKTASSNRDAERELIESQQEEKASANSWAQVVKIIDTQATNEEGKTDAARMRSVLIQLKSNPLKPPISAAEPVGGGVDAE